MKKKPKIPRFIIILFSFLLILSSVLLYLLWLKVPKILEEKTKALINDFVQKSEIGELKFDSISLRLAFPSSIILRNVELRIPEQNESLLTAKSVRLSLPLVKVLRGKYPINVNLTFEKAKITIHYFGNGKFSISPMIESLLRKKKKVTEVSSIRASSQNLSMIILMDEGSSSDISTAIKNNILPRRASLLKNLDKISKMYHVKWEGGAVSIVDELLTSLSFIKPRKAVNFNLTFSFNHIFQTGMSYVHLRLTSPVKAEFKSTLSFISGKYEINGKVNELIPSDLPLSLPRILEKSMEKTVLSLSGVQISISPKKRKVLFDTLLKDLTIPLGGNNEIKVPTITVVKKAQGYFLKSKLSIVEGIADVSLTWGKTPLLALKFNDFPFSSIAKSIGAFSVASMDGELTLKKTNSQWLSNLNLNLTDLEAETKKVLDILELKGQVSNQLNLRLNGFKQRRRNFSLLVSGNSKAFKYKASFSFTGGEIDLAQSIQLEFPISLSHLHGLTEGEIKISPLRIEGSFKDTRAEFPDFSVLLSKGEVSITSQAFSLSLSEGALILSAPFKDQHILQELLPTRFKLAGGFFGSRKKDSWQFGCNLSGEGKGLKFPIRYRLEAKGEASEIKTNLTFYGFFRDEPLFGVANAIATFAGLKGFSLEGNLGRTEFTAFGDIPIGGSLNLGFNARGVRFNVNNAIVKQIGEATIGGQVSGTWSKPIISAIISIPRVYLREIKSADKEFSLIRNVSLPISWNNNQLTFHEGTFFYNGSLCYFQGIVQGGKSDFSITSPAFSLAPVLKALFVNQTFQWVGNGEFSARIISQNSSTIYKASFSQRTGTWEDVGIKRVNFRISGDNNHLRVSQGEINLDKGGAKISGILYFGSGRESEVTAIFDDFPLFADLRGAIVTPFSDIKGYLSGTIRLANVGGEFLVSGDVSLRDAKLLGTNFDTFKVRFFQERNGVQIDELVLFNNENYLQGYGFWGENPADTLINLEVPLINMAIFSPFVPVYLSPLEGNFGANLVVRQRKTGEAEIVGSFQSAGERVKLAGVEFDRIEGRLRYFNGVIEADNIALRMGSSNLKASGSIPIVKGSRNLHLSIEASKLSAQSITETLHYNNFKSDGYVSFNLSVSGSLEHPEFAGTALLNLQDVRILDLISLPRLDGDFRIEENEVFIDSLRAYTATPPINVKDEGSFAEVSGKLKLDPSQSSIDSANLIIQLDDTNYIKVKGYIDGGLSGRLQLVKLSSKDAPLLQGEVTLKKGSEARIPSLPLSAVPILNKDALLDISLTVEKSSLLKYPAGAMEAEFYGALKLNGSLSSPLITGELILPSGSMVVYHHLVRLIEPATITFSPGAGFIPFITGVASTHIPGVLAETASPVVDEAASHLLPMFPHADSDLTIFFHFNNLLTEESLNAVQLSSSPPLPQETIRSYLVGEMPGQVTRSSLETLVEKEALLFSSSRLSRFLEETLEFKRFELRAYSTREGTPLYLNVEKNLTSELSARYLQTFFTTLDERQELALKYLINKNPAYRSSLEVLLRRRAQLQEEFAINAEIERKFK